MERDAKRMRGERPFVFTNLRDGHRRGRRGRLDPPRPALRALSRGRAGPRRPRRALRLVFERRDAAHRADGRRFTLPLQVLSPGPRRRGVATLLLLNPTGGLLAGDRLETDVAVGARRATPA